MAVTPQQFTYIRDFLHKESGIFVPDDKEYLIDTRMMPVIRQRELSDLESLINKMKAGDKELQLAVIEAMTTNETFFFRDNKPFDTFKEVVLPRITEHNKVGELRIWCAACSSGQEPYSLAMLLKENAALLGGLQPKIIATDIDDAILKKASDGVYSQFEVQRGLPIQYLMKYFKQLEEYGDRWQVTDDLKQMITFKKLNLMDSFLAEGKFDFIFCRNVLIYFQPEVKTQVLEKLHGQMKAHALLMLGSSETVSNLTPKFAVHEGRQGLFEPVA